MVDGTVPCFGLPAVGWKNATAAFDHGRLTSDGGVMLLSLAERRLGVAECLARLIPGRRDPARVAHRSADMIRARVFAICCGYEDADDLDTLRTDPAFKLACGRLPDAGVDLCSQPTLSRLESAPGLREAIRLTCAPRTCPDRGDRDGSSSSGVVARRTRPAWTFPSEQRPCPQAEGDSCRSASSSGASAASQPRS